MNTLHKHIRKISLKNNIIVIFPLIIMMVALLILPFKEVLQPKAINYTTDISRAFESGDDYISITFPKIYYTGYTLTSSSDLKGYYYYYIANERIIFILVSDYNCKGQPTLTNYKCTGKLTEWDNDLREVMSEFSRDLNFSITGLSSISYECMINECKYHFYFYLYLLIYIVVTSLLIITFIIHNIIISTIPELHPSYTKLKMLNRKYKSRDILIELEDPLYTEGQLNITENFIISFDKNGLTILPIQDILWAYEHSKFHRFLWIKFKQSYNIHFTCKKNIKAVLNGYSKEQLDFIINYLTEHYPNILIGYSKENKNAVSKHFSRKKDCQ